MFSVIIPLIALLHSNYAMISVNETLDLNFAPEKALVINQGEIRMFRAPMCKGSFIDKWTFTAKVYLMNVPWDSRDVGDDNWLQIRVSNGEKWIRDNAKDTDQPLPYVTPFAYDKNTWGSDDIYIEITASEGSPTYQYGLELVAQQPDPLTTIPDGMISAYASDKDIKDGNIQTLEQVAVPTTSKLTAGQTGQYKIPFCFEDTFTQRQLTATTLVPEAFMEAPGGVASYFCTNGMMRRGECFRAVSVKRGTKFFDASGAKINTVSPLVEQAEYGPVFLLVLAQGDYQKQVSFTITTKLRHPATDDLKLTGNRDTDIENVLSYLKENYGNKPASIDPDFVPDELRDEL